MKQWLFSTNKLKRRVFTFGEDPSCLNDLFSSKEIFMKNATTKGSSIHLSEITFSGTIEETCMGWNWWYYERCWNHLSRVWIFESSLSWKWDAKSNRSFLFGNYPMTEDEWLRGWFWFGGSPEAVIIHYWMQRVWGNIFTTYAKDQLGKRNQRLMEDR